MKLNTIALRTLVALTAIAVLGVSTATAKTSANTSATSAKTSDRDAAFERVLKGIDTLPTRAQMDRAFPDAHDRLLRAAANDKRDTYTRIRAISFLSMYPEAATRSALETLSGHQDLHVRRYGVYTLARTFGVPGDAELVAVVEKATADKVEDVRTHAVRALRWVNHAAAGTLLDRLAKSSDSKLAELAKLTARKRLARLPR